jgi:serine/threonine-protein kinase
MAVVYLAHDLRHERKVALKVLRPEFAAVVGADRFLAEIKTTANLHHPHILPLFDSGEVGGFLFYVMPHVEGESLRERLDRERQLPVDVAVRIATNVAEALDYAHRRGVVHRDIKPGNILLQDDKPVVSDFGIALALGATGTGRLTETGLSLGTPHYMSPEQATGDVNVGPATDIYALGCVLYEMLVGEPPYTGKTPQAILGKIIQGEPASATAVRRAVPANVDAAIRKALEKLPADRFANVSGLIAALRDPGFRFGADVATSAPSMVRLRRIAIAGWAMAALAAAVPVVARLRTTDAPARGVVRFADPFPTGEEPAFRGEAGYALSPDGSMLVYMHIVDQEQVLMVRRWEDFNATPIRDTEGGSDPAVSWDAEELAFVTRDGETPHIRVLGFSGGPVRTLMNGVKPIWGPDGYVYASNDSGTVRAPAAGGPVEIVSRLDLGEEEHVVSDVLPDGRHLLLQVRKSGARDIRELNLRTGRMEPITQGSAPRYASSGHLVYFSDPGTLMAARFDPEKMVLTGPSVPSVDGLVSYSLSNDGKLIYTPESYLGGPTLQLLWVTRDGRATPVDPSWTFSRGPASVAWRVSPDGSMVTLREYVAGESDIWVKHLDTGARSRVTSGAAEDGMPVWVPGSRDITYLSDANGNHDVWTVPADGTAPPELVLDLPEDIASVEWTTDGKALIVTASASDDPRRGVLVFRPGVDSTAAPLMAAGARVRAPTVSRDGRYIAYQSDETGRDEVWVRPFPSVNERRWPVSVDGGRNPKWANNGRELFFEGPDNEMMAVSVSTASDFTSGRPTVLFPSQSGWYGALSGTFYDIAPDDERFLVATTRVAGAGPERPAATARMVLVENFFEELKRLAISP